MTQGFYDGGDELHRPPVVALSWISDSMLSGFKLSYLWVATQMKPRKPWVKLQKFSIATVIILSETKKMMALFISYENKEHVDDGKIKFQTIWKSTFYLFIICKFFIYFCTKLKISIFERAEFAFIRGVSKPAKVYNLSHQFDRAVEDKQSSLELVVRMIGGIDTQSNKPLWRNSGNKYPD